MPTYTTPEAAIACIKSGNRVFIHTAAAAPQRLIRAMVEGADQFENVEIVHMHTEGAAPYTKPEYAGIFFTNSLFIGANVRQATPTDRADYIPVFLRGRQRISCRFQASHLAARRGARRAHSPATQPTKQRSMAARGPHQIGKLFFAGP